MQPPFSALGSHHDNTTNDTTMLVQIRERLFERDNTAVPQPRLAESMRAIDEPVRRALTAMDPEQRQILTHQAARALLEYKGVLPLIFPRKAWAGRRDRVVYDPSPVNHTSAVHSRPPG